MPRLAYGPATRTRRPRPSEKSSPRALRGVPRKALFLGCASPRRGGLRTPAKKDPGSTRGIFPLGHRAIVNECIRNERPRHSCGRTVRTRGAHPSGKTALRLPAWENETRWERERLGPPLPETLQQIEPPQSLRDVGILDGDLSQCLQNRLPPPRFLHLL